MRTTLNQNEAFLELLTKLKTVKWHACVSVKDMAGWLDQYLGRHSDVLKELEDTVHAKEEKEAEQAPTPAPTPPACDEDD